MLVRSLEVVDQALDGWPSLLTAEEEPAIMVVVGGLRALGAL